MKYSLLNGFSICRTIITTIVFIVFSLQADAQQSTFRINYDFNNFDFSSTAGDALTNGNYILAGWNTNIIPLTATITEVNSAGNLVWSRRYTSSISMQINDLKRDVASNTYYACGGTESGAAFIMVLNSTGTPTISRNFSISQANGAYFNRIIKASDGGYVAVGYVTAYDPDGAGPEVKFNSISYTDANGDSQTEVIGSPLIVKFDANGNHLWHHVTRYYKTAAKLPADRIYNDAYFNDVVEVTDGYIAVGNYEVNDAFSTTNSDGDDATPDDAMFFKTTTAGAITYHKQIDAPSTSTSQSSKSLYSIKKTAAGLPLIAGDDGTSMLFMRLPGSGAWAVPTWIRRYSTSALLSSMIVSNFFETYDGNYAAIGQYLNPFAFQIGQGILKVNPSNNSVIFGKSYDLGLFSILPNGSATADKGFISATLGAGGTNFDMQIVKADSAGNAPVDCPAVNLTTSNNAPSYSYGDPYYNSWNANNVTNNAFTPTITTPTPIQTVVCRTIACTAPAQPTVTASANNICPGTQVTINASGGSNVTYKIYTQPTGGTTIGNAPLSVTPSATTTYYVEAEDNANPGCVSTRGSVQVTVLTLASISGNITGSNAVCVSPPSQAYGVTAAGSNIVYTWSVPAGGGNIGSGQGTNNINVNWTTPGNYTITVTVSNSCTPSATRTLSVNVSAGVSGVTAAANPNPICAGNTLNLTGSGTGVTTWAWSGPNSFTANTQNASVANIQANGVGTYTLTGSNACGTATASVSVTVNDVPQNATASATPNPACVGNTVNLSGSATNATSWTWTGPNNYTANTQNPSIANIQTSGAGTYTLSANNSCGFRLATVDVVVNEAPTNVTATATPNPACEGGTVNLSGSATGAVSYSWSGPNNFTSSQLNETISNFQQANVGTYTLNATNSCGTTQGNVSVTISTGPVNLTATANLNNICAASTLNLSATSPNATSYSWTGPNGFTSILQNPSIAPVTVADSGTYVVTAINDCGNSTASVLVDVDTLILNLDANALSSDSICSGESITLSATGNNVNSWSWAGPNNYTSQQQNNTINNASITYSGNYIVTGSNACGDVSDTVSVQVNTVPITPPVITGSNSLCAGDEVYSVTAISNATSYNWTVSGGGTITGGQGTNSITVSWTGPSGNYTVSVSAENNCGGSAAATLSVTILPAPPATPGEIAGSISVCPGIEPYSIPNVTDATNYTWSITGGGTIASGQGTTTASISWTTAGGPYTVSVTASNSCGSSIARIIDVTVNPAPTAPTVTGNSAAICEGETATLTATGSTGGTITYSFYDAATGGNLVGTSPLTVSPTTTTTYYLETVNEFGCKHSTSRVPVTVNVNDSPSDPVVAAGGETVCYGGSSVLSASSIPEGSTITWWDASVNGTLLGTGNTFNTGNVTQTTTYYVQATSADGCKNLSGRTSATITVIPLPEVTLTSDRTDNAVFPNEVITFTASPSSYDNYEFFVNGESVQSSAENTYASSKFKNNDTLSVIATNDGCVGTEQEAVVRVLEFPNAFTPNGDGKNDYFLKGLDIVILNRWGQELYRGLDGWDGTYDGKEVSPGTYYYILTLKDITDRDNIVKGTVLLVQD